MKFLQAFFHDQTGQPSMYRFIFFITCFSILFVYIYKNVQAQKGVIVDFTPEQVKIFLIAVCGKVGQSGLAEGPGGLGGIIGSLKSAIAPSKEG
jgi:hypothetical protein